MTDEKETSTGIYEFTSQPSLDELKEWSEDLGAEINQLYRDNGSQRNRQIKYKEEKKQELDDQIAAIEYPEKVEKDNRQPELPLR